MSLKLEQILKVETEVNPGDWKLIGFSGSPKMAMDLTLVAIGMGIDKSKLLRKIVGDWLLEKDSLECVVHRIKELRETEEGQALTIRDFKGKIRTFLKSKKVSLDLIEKILKEL